MLSQNTTGKVREVYHLDNDVLVMVLSTDRLSAFDVVSGPKESPIKVKF